MPFEIPADAFNALEHARNKSIRANQCESSILSEFKATYQDFWGVSEPLKGSRYTTEQMQAIVDIFGLAGMVAISTKAAQFYTFISETYPGVIEELYESAAFDYTVSENGLVIGALKAGWAVPVEVPPEEAPAEVPE